LFGVAEGQRWKRDALMLDDTFDPVAVVANWLDSPVMETPIEIAFLSRRSGNLLSQFAHK
jgi:hypothetical protein